ncbi:MAG: hypothetical protein ACTSQE_08255 [Candidatus Heimdallarchaeaceae archaeon]
MSKRQTTRQTIKTVKCSVDGEEWFDIPEILALCAINDHYAVKDLDAVLERYNKGHVIPVEYVLYRID